MTKGKFTVMDYILIAAVMGIVAVGSVYITLQSM